VTWTLAVLGLMNSCSAIWRLERPSTSRRSTSSSLAVRLAGLARVERRGPRASPGPKLPQLAGDRGGQRPGAEALELGQRRAELRLLVAVGEGSSGLERAAERAVLGPERVAAVASQARIRFRAAA
jgi:hypothetical protein